MKIKYVSFLLILLFNKSIFSQPLKDNQNNLDKEKINTSISSLKEMLSISDTKLTELEEHISVTDKIIADLNSKKVKISESVTIAAANGLSKSILQKEIDKLKDIKKESQESYTKYSETIEIYKQFYEANTNAIKSIYSNKEINNTDNETKKEFFELIKKNKLQLRVIKANINKLNRNILEINNFLNLVPDWEKAFSKSIQYKIKNTTFKWDSSRLLISWSKLEEAYKDFINLFSLLSKKILDYKPRAKQKQINNFLTILSYITVLVIILSLVFIRRIKAKELNLDAQNFMLVTFINALIRTKWLITTFVYLSLVLLTYYFTFNEQIKFLYLSIWWFFAFYNMWELGKSSINIIIIERHGQLEGLSEDHRTNIGRKIKKLYFILIIIATMLVPGYFYEIRNTLYNLSLYLIMLTFLILLINTLWSINIDAFVLSKSKKIRIVAKGTRFLLLTIMSIALLSFLVEATGFVTLSSTVQQLLLGDMMVIIISWVVYIFLSQTAEALNKQLISSDLISTSTRITLRNFLMQLIGFSIFVSAILLIIKTWTLSFLGTSETFKLSVISVGKYIITISDIVQILIVYFVYRAIYVLLSYLWDSFFIDYLNVNVKFRANFLTLTKYFLTVLFLISAGGIVGFTYKNFVIIFGALGVGIGFGLQNIANDFISGIILLFERPIHIGDLIDIDGEIGQVIKIGSRSTTVITNNKSAIVIPNSYLVSKKLENLTPTENFAAFTIDIGVEYSSDVELVKEVLLKTVKENEFVTKKYEPLIMLNRFADSSINFTVKFWASRPLTIPKIKSDIMFAIEKAFKDNGIKIPFPQHVIHFADEKSKSIKKIKPQKAKETK